MTTASTTEPNTAVIDSDQTPCDESDKYLTFKLADEEYGVEILKVREIIGVINITSVPTMPVHMKGVINLRGKVIPVIDLRLKFGLAEAERTEHTCIIVVNVGKEVGIIVDAVSEVMDIAADNIEPPPLMEGCVDTSFILGMGKVDGSVNILLDIDRVLTHDDPAEVNPAATEDRLEPTRGK